MQKPCITNKLQITVCIFVLYIIQGMEQKLRLLSVLSKKLFKNMLSLIWLKETRVGNKIVDLSSSCQCKSSGANGNFSKSSGANAPLDQA